MDLFYDLLGVPGGRDGGVANYGGGARVGGYGLDALFASAAASADVLPAPLVAVAETGVVAVVVVVAFAAIAGVFGAAVRYLNSSLSSRSTRCIISSIYLSPLFAALSVIWRSPSCTMSCSSAAFSHQFTPHSLRRGSSTAFAAA